MKLIFQSPSILNNSKETIDISKHTWAHASYKGFDNGKLELNVDNWKISCEDNKISESLDEWMVDEDNYVMKLKTEKIDGNFKPLDYAFAVSMLGQLVPSGKLIDYLKSLQTYYMKSEDSPKNEESSNKESK